MGADLYILDENGEFPEDIDYTNGDHRYFRDSYNNSNLAWKLGISYWEMLDSDDIDEDGNINPSGASRLRLRVLESKPILEKELASGWDEADQQYFREKYQRLLDFLGYAIDNNRLIYASV